MPDTEPPRAKLISCLEYLVYEIENVPDRWPLHIERQVADLASAFAACFGDRASAMFRGEPIPTLWGPPLSIQIVERPTHVEWIVSVVPAVAQHDPQQKMRLFELMRAGKLTHEWWGQVATSITLDDPAAVDSARTERVLEFLRTWIAALRHRTTRLDFLLRTTETTATTDGPDEAAGVFRWRGRPAKLSHREFSVLSVLWPNKSLPKLEVAERAWGHDEDGDLRSAAAKINAALSAIYCPKRIALKGPRAWMEEKK